MFACVNLMQNKCLWVKVWPSLFGIPVNKCVLQCPTCFFRWWNWNSNSFGYCFTPMGNNYWKLIAILGIGEKWRVTHFGFMTKNRLLIMWFAHYIYCETPTLLTIWSDWLLTRDLLGSCWCVTKEDIAFSKTDSNYQILCLDSGLEVIGSRWWF